MSEAAEETRSATTAAKAMSEEDDRGIHAWLQELGGDQAVRVQISRLKPEVGPRGENLKGVLETADDLIDESYLKERYGGGKYQLRLSVVNKQGSFVYKKSRQIDISGDPIIRKTAKEEDEDVPARSEAPDSMKMLMNLFQPILLSNIEEAKEARKLASSPDPVQSALLQQIVAGRQEAEASLRTQYEARIDRIIEDNARQLARKDDEHARQLARLDDRHADELRRLAGIAERKDADHAEQIRRMESRHEAQLRDSQTFSERNMGVNEKANEIGITALKNSYEAQVQSLKSDLTRANRELDAAAAKISVLEAKKDQSLPDKLKEVNTIRDLLNEVSGEEKSSTLSDVVSTVFNSELASTLATKIGALAAPTQPSAQTPPPGVPFQTPDGQTWIIDSPGLQPRPLSALELQQMQVRRRPSSPAVRRRRPAQPPTASAEPAEAEGNPSPDVAAQGLADEPGEDAGNQGMPPNARPPSAAELSAAVRFAEAAFNAGTEPAKLANSMRTMVPGDVMRFIRHVGVDALIRELDENHVLATQAGTNYLRSVMEALEQG